MVLPSGHDAGRSARGVWPARRGRRTSPRGTRAHGARDPSAGRARAAAAARVVRGPHRRGPAAAGARPAAPGRRPDRPATHRGRLPGDVRRRDAPRTRRPRRGRSGAAARGAGLLHLGVRRSDPTARSSTRTPLPTRRTVRAGCCSRPSSCSPPGFPHGTVLRLSGLYGGPPGRLQAQVLAGDITEPNRWTNRIHRDDAAAAVVHLLTRRRPPAGSTSAPTTSRPCSATWPPTWRTVSGHPHRPPPTSPWRPASGCRMRGCGRPAGRRRTRPTARATPERRLRPSRVGSLDWCVTFSPFRASRTSYVTVGSPVGRSGLTRRPGLHALGQLVLRLPRLTRLETGQRQPVPRLPRKSLSWGAIRGRRGTSRASGFSRAGLTRQILHRRGRWAPAPFPSYREGYA